MIGQQVSIAARNERAAEPAAGAHGAVRTAGTAARSGVTAAGVPVVDGIPFARAGREELQGRVAEPAVELVH